MKSMKCVIIEYRWKVIHRGLNLDKKLLNTAMFGMPLLCNHPMFLSYKPFLKNNFR